MIVIFFNLWNSYRMLLLSCLVHAVETWEGSNNTWNEVAVVAAGRLIIVPHWLQLTGSSVLCLQEVVTGSQTSCTQQVCLTHLQPGQGPSVCLRVCVALQGKVNPFLCKQSHHTGQNTFHPPTPLHNLQFVRWSHVRTAERVGWRVGYSPDEGLQVQMKEENLFRINGISFYMLSERESLSAQA